MCQHALARHRLVTHYIHSPQNMVIYACTCWVCCVALPCLFDLACFFLSSHIKTCIFIMTTIPSGVPPYTDMAWLNTLQQQTPEQGNTYCICTCTCMVTMTTPHNYLGYPVHTDMASSSHMLQQQSLEQGNVYMYMYMYVTVHVHVYSQRLQCSTYQVCQHTLTWHG